MRKRVRNDEITEGSIGPDTVLDVLVTPKSSRHLITIDESSSIRVYLHSPPMENRANDECIIIFSKLLKIAKSRISITMGSGGRKKLIRIQGISKNRVLEIIRNSLS